MSKLVVGDMVIDDDIEIFFLEDSPVYQKRLVTCVRSIGFKGKITMAGTVAEAKKLITVARPGIIFSDYNLPDGTGMEFLKIVRSERKFDSVPILMVTTMDDMAKFTEAIRCGADDYVVKPFYETEIVDKLAFALEKRLPRKESSGILMLPKRA